MRETLWRRAGVLQDRFGKHCCKTYSCGLKFTFTLQNIQNANHFNRYHDKLHVFLSTVLKELFHLMFTYSYSYILPCGLFVNICYVK